MFLKICDVCGNTIRVNGTATIVIENEEGPVTQLHLCPDCDEATGEFLKERMKKYGTYTEPAEEAENGGDGADA